MTARACRCICASGFSSRSSRPARAATASDSPSSRASSRRTRAGCASQRRPAAPLSSSIYPPRKLHDHPSGIGTHRRGRRGAARGAHPDPRGAAGLTALAAADAREALKLLASEQIALVISDVQMPVASGYELLSDIKRLRADLPVVLMTAYGTIAQAVSAMREGATDYIVKPFDAQALIDMARRQLAARTAPGDLVAADPESKRTLALARKIAENDATVLITGESGTGKEVYARYIRDHSARGDKPFVAINCAAIPDNMLEATLFGYEKGAFTGALAAHAGKFEQAQGGTLLLDEI